MWIVITEIAFMKAAQNCWADKLWALGKSIGCTPGEKWLMTPSNLNYPVPLKT